MIIITLPFTNPFVADLSSHTLLCWANHVAFTLLWVFLVPSPTPMPCPIELWQKAHRTVSGILVWKTTFGLSLANWTCWNICNTRPGWGTQTVWMLRKPYNGNHECLLNRNLGCLWESDLFKGSLRRASATRCTLIQVGSLKRQEFLAHFFPTEVTKKF